MIVSTAVGDPRPRASAALSPVSMRISWSPPSLLACAVQQIWRPDFYWEKLGQHPSVQMPKPYGGTAMTLEVSPNGDVWWSQQTSFEFACPMNLDDMPFDSQACPFVMGLYTSLADEVVLEWTATGTPILAEALSITPPEGWFLPSVEANNTRAVYGRYVYSYAIAQFTFRRRAWMYMASYFFPTVSAVVMSYLGFYIQKNAMPARTGLGIVAMLIVMTNYVALMRALPPGGGSNTRNLPWLVRLTLYAAPKGKTAHVHVMRLHTPCPVSSLLRLFASLPVHTQRLILRHRDCPRHLGAGLLRRADQRLARAQG